MAALAVIGATGWSLIQQSEGVRYRAYRDVGGVWTVCYGHTGPDINPGYTYTQDQCNAILLADIRKHQPVFIPGDPQNCIRNAPINTNQRDALTSFTINVGTGAFCRSTMAKKLAARDFPGASREFPKWNRAAGKVYPGLVTRRAAEQSLFLSNQRSDASDTLSARAKAALLAPLQRK